MKISYWLLSSAAILSIFACNEKPKQSAGSKVASAAGADSTEKLDSFYTGFDGKTDYSLLIPKFREISIQDESIAKVESIKITLSSPIIEELVAEAKKANAQFDEARFRKMLGKEQLTYKITPLKAGKTSLLTSGGRGGKPGKSQAGWDKTTKINLIVSAYTADQLATGKKRYTEKGTGTMQACASCHETGEDNAPPHELGRIMEISDTQAVTWLTSGELKDRVARIPHAWEFNSESEEQGVIAYLRSKQTHDLETLTKLYVEEMLTNGGFMGPPKDAPKN
ncbi:MAG: hypothetical protein NTX25_01720 [Proteobacteria bacterium]|nr:hypothetical protein [Pseudomonadota bacterium]